MNTKLDGFRSVSGPRALFAALALSLLCGPARPAAFDVAAAPAAEGLPAPILSAMSVQIGSMKPLMATPIAMGQMLAQQALAPGGMAAISNNVAAALVIKRALTEPAAAAAIQKSLAAQPDSTIGRQVSRDLAVLRQSLTSRPEALASFEGTMRPLERLQDSTDVKGALDSIFTGSAQRPGERSSDPVLAQNDSGGPKIQRPLQPAPQSKLRRAAELTGAAALLSGTVTPAGVANAHSVFGKTPSPATAPEGLAGANELAKKSAPTSLDPFIQQLNDDYFNAHGFNAGEGPQGLSKTQKVGLAAIGATLLASAFGVQGLITEGALAALIVGFFLVRRVTFRSNLTGIDMAAAAVGQVLRWGGALALLAQIAKLFAR